MEKPTAIPIFHVKSHIFTLSALPQALCSVYCSLEGPDMEMTVGMARHDV